MSYSLFQALAVSKQDMINRLLDLDMVSNNLANVSTTGYKTSRGNFQELLSKQNLDGSRQESKQILTQQGSLATSGQGLDWAIVGDGFFQVRLPDGTTGYTRDGQFQRDANGTLVNADGYTLIWNGTLPTDTVEVSVLSDGTVVAGQASGASVTAGQVQLARFTNPGGLLNHGDNILLPSNNSGQAQTGVPGSNNFGVVKGGAYEQSNVNLSEEMTSIVTLQRAFEMSVRAFQQSDEMLSEAIHMRKV
jgi:flagellar basal-body rod protein FlgG